ncbi:MULTISPECIES: CheR family methyltransferase [unclassified Caballeronia]|uniref:CheR family methyltransferase n=1 Tax=unclassified Caballeronia TaxID=2646786 RepID=UPI002863F897|nr:MULTISPECIES: CheR family methyltransferase [unclassified Caballeronia]MDR5753273.1 CheR family methyltransferase [Caballeronia sp. LZ024]MDR5841012.1 CheR family methyltransferase [Caballeronia sp. LZ031]
MNTDKSQAAESERAGGAPERATLSFPVIGIGASAGGIRALIRFFEHMPSDSGMAFVIVLHLSPKHESRADQVLQRVTQMPVHQVVEPTPIQQNAVYLISPSNDLAMTDGFLNVTSIQRAHGRPVAIDLFFRSLAENHRERAISIVMSGSGSDGAVGIGRIKEQAGVTLVQSPDDAEYDEMPKSAIATGQADIVLPVAEMPQKLIELWENARRIRLPEAPDLPFPRDPASDAEQLLRGILTTLRARTGHDFYHYKRATVLRRIERRMQVNALADLRAYRQFVDEHAEETSLLLRDMLIGVTNFFRDREAFEAVERDIGPSLLESKKHDDQIRIWVPGCSTGEEAYSHAMLFTELLGGGNRLPVLQIFATDIDERAINIARAAVYPESIVADVPASRLRRFFTKNHGHYVLDKQLREKVLFATHNILRDPPFSRLDMVSCRNLLIYMDRSIQRQVLQTFHFALQPSGYLFLGSSESADLADELFVAVDKKHRLYRVKSSTALARSVAQPITSMPRTASAGPPAEAESPRRPGSLSLAVLHQRAVEHHAPPSVIIDREGEILHMTDEAGRFLRYVGGEPSHNLLKLVHPDLRLELRAALSKAATSGGNADVDRVRFMRGETAYLVDISVRPYRDDTSGTDVVLVLFDETPSDTRPGADESGEPRDPTLVQIEEELHRTKEQLQSTIEQSNVSTEELKASNEELQSINEELRSATEELETGKEELQSVNEELIAVNSELQEKVEETDKANDDLRNLIASTGIATVFVDRAMRIKRYTSAAVSIFNVIASDVGRPLLDLTHRLDYPELADDVSAAFDDLKPTQREVRAQDGAWYVARVMPYRTGDDRIDGAVLTLVDISARRSAEQAAHASEERLKLAAKSTDDYAIVVQDLEGIVVSWNKGAERVFGFREDQMIGQSADLIYTAADRTEGVPAAERRRASDEGRAEDERWHTRRDGRRVYCSGVTTLIRTDGFRGFAKIARDVTEKRSAEGMARAQLNFERTVRAQAEAANRLKDEFFAVLSHELKNPLNLIHVKAELLTRAYECRDIPLVQSAADAIRRSVIGQSKIIDDLLDLSRVRTGKLALQVAPVDIAAVLHTVVEASAIDARANDIRLKVTGADKPAMIEADPVRVEQILWNLVRNAIKFSFPGGEVSLALACDGNFACVDVIDRGQGIAPDFLPKIFDMFSQAEGAGRREQGGLGIGLSLVKQLTEMHGGRIEARSDGVGQGAHFRLCLPERPPSTFTPVNAGANDPAILKNLRVLLVDDSLDALDAFRTLLELEGAKVSAVSRARAALDEIAANEFDLVLSDIGMPEMSGYELIAELRKAPRTAKIAAIALTGFGRAQDAAQALQAGFNAHLGKPVSLDSLIATVRRVLA